jgi:hypothetical protein
MVHMPRGGLASLSALTRLSAAAGRLNPPLTSHLPASAHVSDQRRLDRERARLREPVEQDLGGDPMALGFEAAHMAADIRVGAPVVVQAAVAPLADVEDAPALSQRVDVVRARAGQPACVNRQRAARLGLLGLLTRAEAAVHAAACLSARRAPGRTRRSTCCRAG